MAFSWFRLYGEWAADPKVQMLSESDQRRLVMLMCLRSNGHVTLQDKEVTFLLRISNESWLATKAEFIGNGFINDDNELLNWEKRQFVSDSSTARVAKHRENKKKDCNVTVTPQNRTDTDTDTDTDTEKEKDITSATRVADYLSLKIKNYTPTSNPKPQTWVADIDKAIRIDLRSEKELKEIIDWIYSGEGDFWIPNILSGKKLREKFDVIFAQKKIINKNKKPEKPWFLTATGITEKARELGIGQGIGEPFPDFKVRVFKSAELSPDDYKKGKNDYENAVL